MRRNRYGGYRGRRTGRTILTYMIVSLMLLIAVMGAFLFLTREKEPMQGQPSQTEQSQPQGQQPEQSKPEPEPTPEPVPEPEETPMAAVGIGLDMVLDGSWRTYLEGLGANALVLNMKPDDAPLNWDTALSAQDNPTQGLNDLLRKLNAGEVYTVARMSCFRDELLANTYEYCIHSNSGYRWKDFGGVHWVSPASEGVQSHMIALAVELAELGFDEILLDNCGYPQDGSGQMGWIKRGAVYDPEHLDMVIGSFLEELRRAVEPYGTIVSIRTNAQVVQSENAALTGLTGTVLESFAQRVWLCEVDTDAPLAEILSLAGVTEVGERLVIQSAALVEDASWAQAVLDF